jgi:serine/threonine-protein kinase
METMTLYDIAPGMLVAGRYRIVGPHRQGGLSTAFEVTDEQQAERCEMQVFPAGLFAEQTQAADFQLAWQPWREVDSAAVVGVRDVLLEGDTLVLLTDFPGGETLRDRLNRDERLEPVEVLALARQLLAGLSAIHERDLVHGDIKPHTIHLSGSGAQLSAFLVDGGITPGLWTAKNLGEKTALIGTPYYAPPEQFGGGAPDVRSDVYNVAAVLFECLAGVLPWKGSSFLEVFQAKLDRSPPSVAARAPGLEVDARLAKAIATGCLADPEQRHASAAEFLDRLSGIELD